MRRKIDWNTDWYFSKTEKLPERLPQDWEPVTLPHTWNGADGQDGGNDYWRGTAVYCKQFKKTAEMDESRVFLEFQGAAMTAEVFLNGRKLGRHEGGYSTFRAELTEALSEENLLCVTVDNGANESVYPQKADFTFYGGIYRQVSLILVQEVHFALLDNGGSGVWVKAKTEGKRAVVRVDALLEGWKDLGEEYQVCFRLEDQKLVVPVRSERCGGELILEEAHLWDGVRDPYLYRLEAQLWRQEEITDRVTVSFGCRSFSFDWEKGFFLNGKPCPLRGVSRHQDRAGVGNALTGAMHEEDMDFIREIGANSVRLAHYQHDQYFYELCDKYGIIVWAEIPYITKHMPKGRENTLSQMRELVTQCHHHPSIICWGLSNEITAGSSVDEDMLENHRQLHALCHELDDTRPTTMAHVFMLETESPMTQISDIGSYNLYFGWYLGNTDQNDSFFDEYHAKYPERIIGFSEYGADANPRFQTAAPERGDYTEQYQALYHEQLLECIEKRPYLWSAYVWNLFDFGADGRDEGGNPGVNQKGLVTMDRKCRKDAFYLYKAAWSREPFVHLCGRRYAERAEEVTEVKVYSNKSKVSLYVDGTLAQEQEGTRIFRFQVPINAEHRITACAGQCRDEIRIRKVSEPNPEYRFRKEEIVNWFDRDELDASSFSIRDTMGAVMANPEGAALIGRLLRQVSASRGEVAQSTQENPALQRMMAGMTIESLLKQAGDAVKPEQVRALNGALQKIRKVK